MHVLESKTITHEILRTARRMAQLPEQGFLAGGFAADIILGRLLDRKLDINDIDVFNLRAGRLRGALPWRGELMTHHIDGYSHMFDFSFQVQKGACHKIVGSRRDGPVNSVEVKFEFPNIKDETRCQALLESFDLNACQAGVDLATGQLFFTPGFRTFLDTLELKAATAYTPQHTAIRLARKSRTLPCVTCDLDTELRRLGTVAGYYEHKFQRSITGHFEREDGWRHTRESLNNLQNLVISRKFGVTVRDKFLAEAQTLAPYFELTPYRQWNLEEDNELMASRPAGLWQLTPRFNAAMPVLQLGGTGVNYPSVTLRAYDTFAGHPDAAERLCRLAEERSRTRPYELGILSLFQYRPEKLLDDLCGYNEGELLYGPEAAEDLVYGDLTIRELVAVAEAKKALEAEYGRLARHAYNNAPGEYRGDPTLLTHYTRRCCRQLLRADGQRVRRSGTLSDGSRWREMELDQLLESPLGQDHYVGRLFDSTRTWRAILLEGRERISIGACSTGDGSITPHEPFYETSATTGVEWDDVTEATKFLWDEVQQQLAEQTGNQPGARFSAWLDTTGIPF